MGVMYFVLQSGTTRLSVGGHENTVGLLRCVGPSGAAAREDAEAAARRWRGRRPPRAAIVLPLHASLAHLRHEPGAWAPVIAWEGGMISSNDADWNGLPVLGYARMAQGGLLALHASPEADRPMSLEEAQAAGVAGPDGRLLERRRPRILSALSEGRDAWTHEAPSSLGPVVEREERVRLVLDNGQRQELRAEEITASARAEIAAGALRGLTVEEAWAWLGRHARRDRGAEGAAARVLGDGLLEFSCAGARAWLQPRRDAAGMGVMVGGAGGGAGGVLSPAAAFQEIGDRLVRAARLVGAPEEAQIASCADGYLALEVGELGLLLTGFASGEIGVACGGRLPRELHRDTSLRGDAPRGGDEAARALSAWPHEKTTIPVEAVGRFLPDFSRYLAECAAALSPLAEGRPPMFQEFLDRNGIAYGASALRRAR